RKYASNGTYLGGWKYNSAGTNNDIAVDVSVDCRNNILVFGTEDREDIGQDVNWRLIKYDHAGSVLWSIGHNGPVSSSDFAESMAVDSSGNIFLAGGEMRSDLGQGMNWHIRKYYSAASDCSSPAGPEDEVTPGKVKIVGGIRGTINPKRGEKATIHVGTGAAGNIVVRIFDGAGTLVFDDTKPTTGGRHEIVHWHGVDNEGKAVPPGVYPIVITAPGITYRDRLIVVR
ncbi:MAG: hypothetical protein ACYS8Z_26870, partial [Planctomycetota bacterium]